jgi:AraC-like DNA-binding protein
MPRVKIDYARSELWLDRILLFCFDMNAGPCNRDGKFMDSSALERIYFDTDALPERDRFPMFCEEIGRRYMGLDFRTQDQSRFSAKLALQRVGLVDIVHSSNVALDSVRTPQLVRDGDDSLCVILLESGSGRQTQCGNDHELASPTAIVCDAGYAGACNLITDAQLWSLRIPRRKITRLLPRVTHFAGAKLDKDITAQRLLFGYLRVTFDGGLNAGRVIELYGEHIIDLVALALGAEGEARAVAEERGACAARRSAILREIERRSGNPDLSAVTIALFLGITPRYVHLLLEETGKSFTHHVLERRLDKAAALLRHPLWCGRRIADIAAEAGFTDLSYFNRAFRRHFAATPSDIRAAANA